MRIGCVVMASGEGRRFAAATGGRANKLLAPVAGEPLVVRTVRSVPAPFEVVVSTRWPQVADAVRALGVPAAVHGGALRSESVRAGLACGADRWDGCLFLPGDQPLVRPESFAALARAFGERPDRVCRLCWRGATASPVLFPRRLFEGLLGLSGAQGGGSLVRAEAEVALVEARDGDELLDVDTPDDLARVCRRIERRPG